MKIANRIIEKFNSIDEGIHDKAKKFIDSKTAINDDTLVTIDKKTGNLHLGGTASETNVDAIADSLVKKMKYTLVNRVYDSKEDYVEYELKL